MHKSKYKQLLIIPCLLLLSACASTDTATTASEADPWNDFNRSIYHFNEKADEWVLKPVAIGYRNITPGFIRTGVANFFRNLGDILVIPNDILQLKLDQALADTGRLLLNSTLGVFGFFDVATPIGLVKHNEDFGQTFGYWGVGSGPYLVLPFLGPSTLRDATGTVTGFALNSSINPVFDPLDGTESAALIAFNAVNIRSQLLSTESVFDAATIGDRYSYLRDAWLARRRYLVHDGAPDNESAEFDEIDEIDKLDEIDEIDDSGEGGATGG